MITEFLPRMKEARPHGAFGHTQDRRRFYGRALFHRTQHEGHSVVVRELRDASLEGCSEFSLEDLFLRVA